MSTRLLLFGGSGRMGQEIACLAKQKPKLWTSVTCLGSKDSLEAVSPDSVDMVIDFSSAQAFAEILSWSQKSKKPMVSGTTGLGENDFVQMANAAKDIAFLWAPNMSLGVAVLAEMLELFANLNEFDFQIEEFHHRYKIDSPSGTALFLQEKLVEALSSGNRDMQSKPLPQPLSVRGGGIFGVHRVHAMSEDEVITLEHQALGRTAFARGALKAAHWLKDKKSGQYTMLDLLRG